LGFAGMMVFATLTRAAGQSVLSPALRHPAVAIRWLAEIVAGLFMVNALALTPLSLVTSVTQAGPLVVTLGAVILFRETVGWRRWCAIAAGLCGVMIILRPGTEAFNIYALLSVGAMLALAARDLSTRASPVGLSNLQLATVGFSAFNVGGVLLVPFNSAWTLPDLTQLAYLVLAILPTLAAYYAITAAMRVGEISAITPFRYTRLLFGLVLGMVFFGERIDGWMLAGCTLVVASGVYTVLRERSLRRRAARADDPVL
jgi:drug/metabolite transporter (DMT)-like permease